MENTEVEVRDMRNKGWFWLDNIFLDRYAKFWPVSITVVYLSLCRHADNKTQKCFPGMQLVAEEFGISTKTVQRATAELEKYGLVSVTRGKKSDGTRAKNIYILTSINAWKKHPSDNMSHGSIGHLEPSPEDISAQNHGTPGTYNYTHNNKTHITTPREESANKDKVILEELFGAFWEAYPLKQTKKPAHLKWMHLTPMEALTIIEDVEKRKKSDDRWLRGYIPQPLTYINQRRWEDEITQTIKAKPQLDEGTPYVKNKYADIKVKTIKNVIKPKE